MDTIPFDSDTPSAAASSSASALLLGPALLLLLFLAWHGYLPCRTSGPEPKFLNIVASCWWHLPKPFRPPRLTHSNVMDCFEITALLSAVVPKSATCSSLLTLRTLICLESQNLPHMWVSTGQFTVCGERVWWLLRQWPDIGFITYSKSHTTTTPSLLTQMRPTLLHTSLTLRGFSQ